MTNRSQLIDTMLSSHAVLDTDSALKEIANPGNWTGGSSKGNWRTYVPGEIRDQWNNLPLVAKVAVYVTAMERVDAEEYLT